MENQLSFETAKAIYNSSKNKEVLEALETIFPKLCESEDNMIKEELIKHLKDGVEGYMPAGDSEDYARWLAWLEKQGKQKPIGKMQVSEKLYEYIRNTCACIDDALSSETLADITDYLEMANKDAQAAFDMIEKQGEQKSVDKEEPKFHEGEYITNGDYTWKIVEVKSLDYILQSQDGNIVDDTISHVDEQFHSFTIEDAKDGDVLSINWNVSDDSWEKIIIFKKYHNKGVKGLLNAPCVEGYGNTFKNGELAFNEEVPYYSKTWTCNLQPATKEQRELLFQKMTEASCEWDAEKKELKKIEPKHEDETTSAIRNKEEYKIGFIDGEAHAKEKMELSWSEEDKYIIEEIEAIIDAYVLEENNPKALIDWLKSLKDRYTWKPSEEQLRTLNLVVSDYYHACTKECDKKAIVLKSILEQLEQL